MNDRLGVLDEHWEAYEVVADEAHRFLWMWHGFNIRVIAVPQDDSYAMGYEYAWCYRRDPEWVVHKLRLWTPDQEDEPWGWHKRALRVIRRAPHRDQDPHYNRPRCEHGCYIDEGCRTINCPGMDK